MNNHTDIKLFSELNRTFSEITKPHLEEILQLWGTIYGTDSGDVVGELSAELTHDFKEFFYQQVVKLTERKNEFVSKIGTVGQEAVQLEKVLGLEPQVKYVQGGPLVQMEEQLLTLLESYEEMKMKRQEEYDLLQKKEKELCSVLNKDIPIYEIEIPTSDEISKIKERIRDLQNKKEELEYDFENNKSQLRELVERCSITPLTKYERFALDKEELPVTMKNLNMIKSAVDQLRRKEEDMMIEADHLRDQIDCLSKKMFKDPDEIHEFLLFNSDFKESTIKKLKEKFDQLKMERKDNLKELIEKSRILLVELWDRCCYCETQRKEFKPYNTNRWTEEVLELHELEIENLEHFYNENKKIFTLAMKHEELWDRMLHLEGQANNKDRLFSNRGGCLLKEEKERKVIQKKVPAVKEELFLLLNDYKERTGKDFMIFGEPLQQTIEKKERLREMSKGQEKLQRKMGESRLGPPNIGCKRKAVMTPDCQKIKSMRTETTTISSASSKSTASSGCVGTLVMKEQNQMSKRNLNVPTCNYAMRTPNGIPAASTPQNGSLSYESFQGVQRL